MSEIINHIKKTFETSTGLHPILLLAEMRELFDKTNQRLKNKVYSVHHTRFKNDLLKYMPSLKALKKGGKHCAYYRRFNYRRIFRKFGKM